MQVLKYNDKSAISHKDDKKFYCRFILNVFSFHLPFQF